jgi:membrane protease YdiL (CAAX protease family)
MLVVSSVLFALVHHIGPLGEPLESYSFVYRALCGMLLGTLFLVRGFGVAVWTHAIYNALALLQESAGG